MKVYRSYEDLPKIKLPLGQEVFISDSTIRDGSQMPGIVMKKNTRPGYMSISIKSDRKARNVCL